MAHLLQTLVSFTVVLGVLVFIHELGHYIAARACGVYVEAFSIGFGPALLSWTARSGTVWKLSALPLGGYVKMHGMSLSTLDEAAQDGEAFRADQAYFRKSVWQRMVIAAAGPVANFLLAFVLLTALWGSVGQDVLLPVVGSVEPGSAAASAGLQPGDEIRAIDGQAIASFEALRDAVSGSAGRELALEVHRGAADLNMAVRVGSEDGIGRLGVRPSGKSARVRYGLLRAIAEGANQTWSTISQVVQGLVHILSTGRGANELGGVITIAKMSGQVAQLGIVTFIMFIALLSVNLGIVNLLPIPILDGGHLMFYAAEALRGKPVPPRAQEYGYRVGFAIIAMVFVFVSFNDLVRAGAFRWFSHLTG